MPKPKLDPRQQQFWDEEEQRLWDEIAELMIQIFFSGGKGGHDGLPAGARVLVNWDLFNQDAVRYLRDYRLSNVKKISDATRSHSIDIIDNWVKSGEPLNVLEAQLEPWFSPERAERIAVTEVTEIYAEANQTAWQASGIVGGNTWHTAEDDKVCPICAPLAGMTSPLDENGFTTEEGGIGLKSPPAHVKCRCWLTPTVDENMYRDRLREALYE